MDFETFYGVYMDLSNIWDLWRYDPYRHINLDDKYFEDEFLDYFLSFRDNVERLKEKLGHKKDKAIDKKFLEVVRTRNDFEIDKILRSYGNNAFDNEKAIVELKRQIRIIKDIILATEPADMKRMQKIDRYMGLEIDKVSLVSGETEDPIIEFMSSEISHSEPKENAVLRRMTINQLIDEFKFDKPFSNYDYQKYILFMKDKVNEITDYYRKNFSVETATKYIKELKSKLEKVTDREARRNGLAKFEISWANSTIEGYQNKGSKVLETGDLEEIFKYITFLKTELVSRIDYYDMFYSEKLASELTNLFTLGVEKIIDKLAKKAGFPKIHERELLNIFDAYKPENLDIFDIVLYSSEEERDLAMEEYRKMTLEEKKVFEMRMYEQYIRKFKRKLREFNKDVRKVYSGKYADRMIASINKRADKLISEKAKEIGRPVSKNPWLVRKYLYADTTNFMSENGLKFRKFINPLMRNIVKVAMDNKLIIEERPKLDPTKQYIFVSTHYFTEDVIGLFSSLGTQAYMLMGTTDQIENNPLMLAAVLFGFFHVDRMDSLNRMETFEKQNKIIENGANFINYVGGSWENSENELQPLSFSGPIRTSLLTGAEIVPVASYLVREDKTMYVRFGEPMDLSMCSEEEGNQIIRDTLASMHFKQLDKYSFPIKSVEIPGYGKAHDLPYDQHTYYMDQVGNEYWHQPWTKPFAEEEIGLRHKKEVPEEEVYTFIDNLSRDKLIELSSILGEPLVRREEKERYDIVSYIDRNYEKFKDNNSKKRVRRKKEEE